MSDLGSVGHILFEFGDESDANLKSHHRVMKKSILE